MLKFKREREREREEEVVSSIYPFQTTIVRGSEVPGLRHDFPEVDFDVGERYVKTWTPPPLMMPDKVSSL